MNKRLVTVGLISATILIAIGIAWAQIGKKRKGMVWRPTPQQQSAAPDDSRTLKEKARDSRNFAKTEAPKDLQEFKSLKELTNASNLVVIGTVKTNITRLSHDEKTITIDYTMVAEKVYKGDMTEGDDFTVSVPGGKVIFRDGSAASVSTPWFKKMQDNKTYLLFLKQGETFTTIGGPRGLFQIPTDKSSRAVQAHTLIEGDPLLKYNDIDVKEFLRELRQTLPKEKRGKS